MEELYSILLDKILIPILNQVSWIAYLLVIGGGMYAKYKMPYWKWNTSIKTLLSGFVLITGWVGFMHISGDLTPKLYPKLFMGYLLALGTYPYTVKLIIDRWQNRKEKRNSKKNTCNEEEC